MLKIRYLLLKNCYGVYQLPHTFFVPDKKYTGVHALTKEGYYYHNYNEDKIYYCDYDKENVTYHHKSHNNSFLLENQLLLL